MPDSEKCYIRVLHAIPDARGVDLYINDHLTATDFKYQDFTQYYGGSPGIYNFKAYTKGQSGKLLIDRNIELDNEIIYTLALTGVLDDPCTSLIPDTKKQLNKSRAYIRYINISPSVTTFDIIMNGSTVVTDLDYNEISDYVTLEPGTYSMKAVDIATGKVELDNPRMTLHAGKEYAGYLVGMTHGSPEMQILIPLEGSTYLTF